MKVACLTGLNISSAFSLIMSLISYYYIYSYICHLVRDIESLEKKSVINKKKKKDDHVREIIMNTI